MQNILHAGFVSVDEIDGALVVGFADQQYDTKAYFMLQRGLEQHDDEGVYLEHTDQAHGAYGEVMVCLLSGNRIELSVDEVTAKELEVEATFAVEFLCDEPSLNRLELGLKRVFRGTDCRFEKVG